MLDEKGVQKKHFWVSHVTFGSPTQNDPHPNSPSWPPHTFKRGANLFRIYAAICLHILMSINLIREELWGKNWYAHTLALTTCLVHRSSQKTLCLLHYCKNMQYAWTASLESIAGNLPVHTPAAYLGPGGIAGNYVTRHPDPPLYKITQ